MKNKTHTPGPWKIDEAAQIVTVNNPTVLGRLYIGECYPSGEQEWDANAELIASAPELLAERDQLKADLKLVNDCWQADIKEISALKEQLRILGLQMRDQKLLEYEKSFIDHLKESKSKLLEAMQLFVDRIDHAEIRSSKEFKSLIEKYK